MSQTENFDFHKHTQRVFIGSKLLSSPLEAMFGLLAFIFCKDLHATPLQITLLVSLRPVVALLSFYGNVIIKDQPQRLKMMIIGGTIIGVLPCFFFPFVHSIWFFLFGYALFMTSLRAVIPAWSEILKINADQLQRGQIFSRGSSVNYLINIFVPLLLAPWIDYYPHSWKWIFCILAAINLLAVSLLVLIKLKSTLIPSGSEPAYNLNCLGSILIGPWKNCWALMRQRADFRRFQIVFMLGGAGLMVMHPVLPVFFKETLKLSYTELTFATSLCKGVSFALTAPFWASLLNRIRLHLFNFYVTASAALFALLIMASDYHLYWIYGAYLLYGTMQAGSELSWNLSGPIFAKEKDSTLFSGVNVAMVGMRGCIAPSLGEALFLQSNAFSVFLFGGGLCLSAAVYSLWLHWEEEAAEKRKTYTLIADGNSNG